MSFFKIQMFDVKENQLRDKEINLISSNTENNLYSRQCIKFVLELGVNVRLGFVCDSVNDGAPRYIID